MMAESKIEPTKSVGSNLPQLTDDERAVYDWQFDVGGFGEESQRRLKASTVLISRVGGLGGSVAWQLAAAGIGKLKLAHAGNIKSSDLNRQTLMTHDRVGEPRLQSAIERLQSLNPRTEIEAIPENANPANAVELARGADCIVDCAPLFAERFALNHAAIENQTPIVECAVNDLELHLTSIVPGSSACLRCIYPEENPEWKRRFPVLGAVSGSAGSLAAMEVIKILTGMGQPLIGKMLVADLRSMDFRKVRVYRNPDCPDCSQLQFEGGLR